jgi:trimethylamine--corrinoid protein Co-methyltransferase
MFARKKYPQFRVLPVADLENIHHSTLHVLENIGVRIYAEEAIELLESAGCKRAEKNLVRIPSSLVEEAIQTAPERFSLYNRDGVEVFSVGGNNVYFGTSPTAPFTHDLYSGKRRAFELKDSINAAKLANKLANIDFVMPFGTPQDVPQEAFDVYIFEATVSHTKKPIVFLSNDAQGTTDIIEMASIVAGNVNILREKPFVAQFIAPLSPLIQPKEAIEKLMAAVRSNIPVFSVPGPVSGATNPTPLAGSLVLANAEILTQLTIAQLENKGTPFGVGVAAQIMDMATANPCVGTPESCLIGTALGELARHYNLPTWGTAGTSDSKILDEQAAIEVTMSILMSSLSGLNMVHDLGYLENGLVGSLEMLTMCDEIVGAVKRMGEGITISDDTLSLKVIQEVGIGGEFLTHDQTLRYYRTEHWHPTLMDRNIYDRWLKDGAKTMRDRINEKTQELIRRESVDLLPRNTRSILEQIRAQSERQRNVNL